MPGESEYYDKVSESIKLIFDLTSRIDERVKILVEQHNETHQRIEKIHERYEGMMNRIVVLENKNGSELKHAIADLKSMLNNIDNQKDALEKRIRDNEVKLAALEIYNTQHMGKWKLVGDFIFKVVMLGLGAFLTWKVTSK